MTDKEVVDFLLKKIEEDLLNPDSYDTSEGSENIVGQCYALARVREDIINKRKGDKEDE